MSEKDRMRRFALMVRSGKLNSYNKNHPSYEEWLDDLDKKVSNVGADKWKALDKIDYKAIPDTSFTRDRTGAGSIEYFSANEPGIRYPNGYYVLHPMPGNDVILYNPNDNDELDIRLDALHIMPKDATYDALNSLYRDRAMDSDVSYNALLRYAEDVLRYGLDNVDSYELYFNNEADGLLRNMFIEGTPEYIESKNYYPDKLLLREWNKDLLPYIDRILTYLETGERPEDILPEFTKSYNSMPNSVLVDRDSLMMDSDGNFYDEDGNVIGDSVILPEINVRAKDREKHADEYKSAFDPDGAGEFAATMMNSPLLLGDYAFNRFIDAGKGEYDKTDYRYTPVQTTMQRVGETISPTKWAGTVRSGFKESPWSENNPGLMDNPYLDMMTDVFAIPAIAKGVKAGYLSTPMGKYTAKRGTWYSPIEYTLAHTPVGKRAIEVGMRITGDADPAYPVMEALRNSAKFENRKRTFNAINYILTGRNKTGKPISLVDNPYQGYDAYELGYSEPDVIDAFLYGKTPNSNFFKEVGEDPYTANAIKESIRDNYPHKNIKFYEAIDDTKNGKLPDYVKPSDIEEFPDDTGFLIRNDKNGPGERIVSFYDAAGNRLQKFKDATDSYERHQDIWKYNAKDFAKKYFDSDIVGGYEEWAKHHKMLDFLLNTVDEAGNPIVVRTPWKRTSHIMQYGIGEHSFDEGGPEVTLVDSDKVRMNNSGVFSDDKGNIIGNSVVLPEVTVKPTTPQTNDSSYYQQWLMREADRGGKNMSSSDREAYDKMMSRVANQNEVKNFTGFDGTIYNHGSGALEQVSPEFDALTLGRQFYTDGLFRNFIKKASNSTPKIQKPYVKRYSMFDDADFESFTIDDMPEAKGDIYEPVVVNGKKYPSKEVLMNKVELVKPEHLNDAHQLALREIRDYVLSDEFRQRLINNGFDPDKYQHALLRYLDTKVKYGELLPGTYGVSMYASDPSDMEIILNNKVLDTDYDTLVHELLHAQTRHLDSESSFLIKNKIDELLMDIMKYNESIQPQMSLDAMKASGLTTDELQTLSYVEEPQEFRARVGASVLDAKRRGIDFDDYVDNHNYDLIRSLKYFYNKDDIKRYAKRFLTGLPFVSAIATNRINKTLTDNTDNNRSYGGRIGYSNHKFDEGGPENGITLIDDNNVRMDNKGLFRNEQGNVIGDSVILPEFVVNGVDINRVNKHASTEYNDNTRIGLEKGTLAKAHKYDDTVNLATSIPGTLITAPLWGPALLNTGDAFLGTTLGRGMTSLATNPYTQAGLLSAGLADTIDRRLIKDLHPDYSENPFMAGVLDVFDASMVLGGVTNGYKAISNIAKPIVNSVKDWRPLVPNDPTIRLYRATGTSGIYDPSPDGGAEFSGLWFTINPNKPQRYASRTVWKAKRARTENPIELQYVDIPLSQLDRYKAENILKGRTDIEFEPTEDFLIPLEYPRGRVSLEGYTGDYLKDTRMELPKELPDIVSQIPSKYMLELEELVPRYNKFAEYYLYPLVPEGTSLGEAEQIIKNGLDRHNTFYRGLHMPSLEETAAIRNIIGKDATDREVLEYLAKVGSRDPYNTYLSLDDRAGQYAKNADIAILKRKYKLGDSPSTWIEDADFVYDTTPATGVVKKGSVNYPWASKSMIEKAPPGEIRMHPDDFTFEGWLPVKEWEYGKYVPAEEFKGSNNLYFNEAAGHHKPSFAKADGIAYESDRLMSTIGSDDVIHTAGGNINPYKNNESIKSKIPEFMLRYFNGRKISGYPESFNIDDGYAQTVKTGLPEAVKEDLIHNTVRRNVELFELYLREIHPEKSEADIERIMGQYKDYANKLMDNVKIGEYTLADYTAAGNNGGGFYDDARNFISVNTDFEYPVEYIMKHEGRHLLDRRMPSLTPSQELIIAEAYDGDFLRIPETEYAGTLKDYQHMAMERVTTNRDARETLLNRALGENRSVDVDIETLNKIIDEVSDDAIFSAVRDANGYGKRYILLLKDTGRLTHEKADQFRNAMKKLGIIAIPITIDLSK